MEDIGFFNQGWRWLLLESFCCSGAARAAACSFRDKTGVLMRRHWPAVCYGCAKLGRLLLFVMVQWKDCFVRGCRSFFGLGTAALFVIIWSCFLSLTSMSCLLYVLLSMGAAGGAVHYLGYTPGLFIVGLFAILVLWMYANFWITGTLFIVGGYLFSLNHARLVVLMATAYALYCVKAQVGWPGVLVSTNLAFLSNDALTCLLQWCDNLSEKAQFEEQKIPESFVEDDFPAESEFSVPAEEAEKVHPCQSAAQPAATSMVVEKQKEPPPITVPVVKDDGNAVNEMKRIHSCVDHYETLGFSRYKKIDAMLLRKEYRKKAMLVHPDKNMGSPLASESFKKSPMRVRSSLRFLEETRLRRAASKGRIKESVSQICQHFSPGESRILL